MTLERCVCGHIEEVHSNYYDYPMCQDCANVSIRDDGKDFRHLFQLDNLALIEKMAREKGLI